MSIQLIVAEEWLIIKIFSRIINNSLIINIIISIIISNFVIIIIIILTTITSIGIILLNLIVTIISSVTIVPSRAESFGQVAAESLSCETPVIAFNYSGLTDIVKHKENGYLAEPFDAHSLADGILWFYSLSDEDKAHTGISGRNHVLEVFSEEVIGKKLISIYKELGYQENWFWQIRP